MSVTHAKQTTIPEDVTDDPQIVGPDDWNAEHVIELTEADIPAEIARDTEVAQAITDHAAAADPHTGYLKENDANYVDLTDGGATTLHSHATDFGEAGDIVAVAFGDTALAGATGEIADAGHRHAAPANPVTAHEAAADPHTGYLKETDFDDIDFLVGTATGHTGAEIVVGTAPGGELGGTWASPTVDAAHSGSTHAATQAAAEATAAAALSAHESDTTVPHKLDDLAAPDDNSDLNASTSAHGLMQKYPGGTTTFLRADGSFATPTASVAFTAFTQDLGVADRAGTFDITGLAGLSADKPVIVMQTAAQIASKGNARDEPEMDQIHVTGYVVDANTIRCYWQAPSVVVGTYAFAYLVGG